MNGHVEKQLFARALNRTRTNHGVDFYIPSQLTATSPENKVTVRSSYVVWIGKFYSVVSIVRFTIATNLVVNICELI